MLYSMLKAKLKKIAPPENGISDDLYGLQFGAESEDRNIRKIVVCLDPTKEIIIKAKKINAHLIISHHGITHKPILYFNEQIFNQIKLLALANVDLFVIHSAWDAAIGGVSESFAKSINLQIVDNFNYNDHGKEKPIGRIGTPLQEKTTLKTFLSNIRRHLHIKSLQYSGNLTSIVSRVAIIGGRGVNEEQVVNAHLHQCDTIITGEVTYPEWLLAKKLHLNLITTSHYISENPGMKNLAKLLSLAFPRDEITFFDSNNPISIFYE
jgi:dinuclear metal center YbgI/SA1388 family protein